MTPSDTQAAGIRAVVDWYMNSTAQEFYIGGYAGVGKSFLAKFALDELAEKAGVKRVRTGAFTGKAASVLRRKGVSDAMTIHGMAYKPEEDLETGQVTFKVAIDAPASEADLIVLDECSMVDEQMASDLRSYGKKILVMGDPGQLPPVGGQGAFTNRKPDVFLTEIHRQAADSPIIRLATMARKGQPIPVGDYGQDCVVEMLNADTAETIHRADTQVICGLHKVRYVITSRMRRKLGYGDLTGEVSRAPQAGERIMCMKNNRERGIFNGGQGFMDGPAEMIDDHLFMTVKMDDLDTKLKEIKVHPYHFAAHFGGSPVRPRMGRGIEEFDWGYVLTCHKAQGSEWPHVTTVDDSRTFREDRDKWLYTAITRASSGMRLLKRS